VLSLDTTARSLLGDDLPLVDDAVTVRHLLSHRSGIGDYLDESADADINDYPMRVPVHRLADVQSYLRVLDGHPQREAPGDTFRYNNGGFVVLSLLAERAAGQPFDGLVDERVSRPAALTATGFDRSDELPGDVAVGYPPPVLPSCWRVWTPVCRSGRCTTRTRGPRTPPSPTRRPGPGR